MGERATGIAAHSHYPSPILVWHVASSPELPVLVFLSDDGKTTTQAQSFPTLLPLFGRKAIQKGTLQAQNLSFCYEIHKTLVHLPCTRC